MRGSNARQTAQQLEFTGIRPIRILELRSARGTGGGPEKTILHGAARTDASRFAVTVCYIRDARDTVFAMASAASALPVDYVEVVERHSFDVRIWPALRALVRSRQIDIVHSHEYKTDFLAWLLARFEGITPLATVHGWNGRTARERLLYYPADRWLLRRFPTVLTVSALLRDTLVRTGGDGDRVLTVLNGIDATAFARRPSMRAAIRQALDIAPDVPVVGSVGRIEYEKQYPLLVDAFAIVRRTHPGARLLIAGTGSRAADVEQAARRHGLEPGQILLGHRPDVADLLQAFDVFVQSSSTEGTPNAVLEAMAVEVPVVATTAGGTAQLMDDRVHGLLVPVGQASALADAVRETLEDPTAARDRADAARRRIEEQFSFDTRLRRVEAVYEQLVSGAERRRPR